MATLLSLAPLSFVVLTLLFQPWYVPIFILLMDISLVLASIVSSLVTILVYWAFYRKRTRRSRPVRKISPALRQRLRHGLGAYILILMIACAWGESIISDLPPREFGIPGFVPRQLTESLDFEESRYYQVNGWFLQSEDVWRAKVSKRDLTTFIRELELERISRDDLPKAFLRQTPIWWQPQIRDETKIYSSEDFPLDGYSYGIHYMLAWNPDDEQMHLWMKAYLDD